jgi:hypothetical protein
MLTAEAQSRRENNRKWIRWTFVRGDGFPRFEAAEVTRSLARGERKLSSPLVTREGHEDKPEACST